MPWNLARRTSSSLLRPACTSLRYQSSNEKKSNRAPKALSNRWFVEVVLQRKIGHEVVKYVQASLALPPCQRLSVSPPPASETEDIFIAECLALSLLRPGQWSRASLLACDAWFAPYAQLLDAHEPALLQQLIRQALLHLPSAYSLSGQEVEAFAGLVDRCRHARPLAPDVVAAFSLRRAELASRARLVRSVPLLTALFCGVSRTLHGAWRAVPHSDRLLAGVVLDHLAGVIDDQLAAGGGSGAVAGGVALTPPMRDFCAQVLFCRFDHPACNAALARYFAACLESPLTSFEDCAFMAYFLGALRVPAAAGFFARLAARLPATIAGAAASPAALARQCGSSVPRLLAWALLAEGVAVPTALAGVVAAFPVDQDAERFGASLDALATCDELVALALGGGGGDGNHGQQQQAERIGPFAWMFWHAGQARFFAECGFDVNAAVGGGRLRAALVALAVPHVAGTAAVRRWPRAAGVAPAQLTPDTVRALLPAVPVALLPGERLYPSGRQAGPHWHKARAMRAHGWGVAFAEQSEFVADGGDEVTARWLRSLVFKAARDQQEMVRAQQQQQQQQEQRAMPQQQQLC